MRRTLLIICRYLSVSNMAVGIGEASVRDCELMIQSVVPSDTTSRSVP